MRVPRDHWNCAVSDVCTKKPKGWSASSKLIIVNRSHSGSCSSEKSPQSSARSHVLAAATQPCLVVQWNWSPLNIFLKNMEYFSYFPHPHSGSGGGTAHSNSVTSSTATPALKGAASSM